MTSNKHTTKNFDDRLQALAVRRVGAFLVDVLILYAVLAPIGFLIQLAFGSHPWWESPDYKWAGPTVWRYALLNFSLPSWLYFTLCDYLAQGATLGKRLFRLRVMSAAGGRLSLGQALVRTAIKLLPWELSHISFFALSSDLSRLSLWQCIGFGVAYGLVAIYFIVIAATRGRRSLHDLTAGAEVRLIQKALPSSFA